MQNTLDLDPEFGAIELWEDLEHAFGIKLSTAGAENWSTVGHLYDAICAQLPDWDSQNGKCATAMTFYGIRRALDPDRVKRISPTSALPTENLPRQLFRQIETKTGLRLPSLRQTRLGWAGNVIFLVGLVTLPVAFLNGHWMVAIAAFAIALAGFCLIAIDPRLLPAGIGTVGDLASAIAPLNTQFLKAEGARPSDRWSVLATLAAEYGSLRRDEITAGTFLHASSLKLATAA